MMQRRSLLLAGAGFLAAPAVSRAQDYPSRPIRVVVPYAPGGQSDTVMRLLIPRMSEFLGQNIIVENRSGGGGTIGAGIVAAAPADGYTLFFESFAYAVAPLLHRGLPFDYENAFVPIGQAVALPYVLVTKRDYPARDVAEFLAAVKARPGFTYGTPGIGTIGHLAGALLEYRAGIKLEHVAYRGGAESARDVAAGNIDGAIGTANSFAPIIQSDRARGIALTSGERRGSLSHLPTLAESGFPGFDLTSWNGLFAPAATPAPIRARLEAALRHATTDEPTRQRLAATGNDAVTETADAFAARITKDRAVVRQLIQQTGLKIE
jgi:tripartite-type tricarboxylate transporter receptor subunit TctC